MEYDTSQKDQIYHKRSRHRSGLSQFFIIVGIVATMMGLAASFDAWILFFTKPTSPYITYLLFGSNTVMIFGLISIRLGCRF